MRKTLLRSLAALTLLGATLSAMADNVYYTIPSLNWLADGQRYVVGVVARPDGNASWQGKIPFVYTANDGNTAFTMQAVPNENFTENMIWTLGILEGKHCTNIYHTGHNYPVVQFKRDDKAIGFDVNSYNNKSLYGVNDGKSYIEVISATPELSGITDYFTTCWQTAPNSTGDEIHFRKSHSVLHDGTQSFGTISNANTNPSLFDAIHAVGGGDGTSTQYSSFIRTYLVISDDNLSSTAAVIWHALTEDDIANNSAAYSEAKIAELRARQCPALTASTTAANLMQYLQSQYAAYLAADFAGKYLQFYHTVLMGTPPNQHTRNSAIGIENNALKVFPNHSKVATTWFAEYDADEDAVRLSIDGQYMGAIGPNQNDELSLAANAANAGLYRFYPQRNSSGDITHYLLTCKRYSDGTTPAAWRTGTAYIPTNPGNGAVDGETNNWVNDRVSAYNTPGVLSRWGSGAGTAQWQISVVGESEEDALNSIARDEAASVYPNISNTLIPHIVQRALAPLGASATFMQKSNAVARLATTNFTTAPDATKFYRILSAREFTSGPKALYTAANADDANITDLRWGATASESSSIWAITPTESANTYELRNLTNGLYVARNTSTGNTAPYSMQYDVNTVTFTRISDSDAQYVIKATGSFHCLGHNAGAGNDGRIIAYNSEDQINMPSAWYIEPLTDSETETLLQEIITEASAVGNVPDWASNSLDELTAIINSSEATASEKIDAHLAISAFNPTAGFANQLIKLESYGRPGFFVGFGGASSSWMHLYDTTDMQDHTDFLFYFDAEHKLHHVLSGNAVKPNLEIGAEAEAGALTFEFAAYENCYKIISHSGNQTLRAHDMGTSNASYVNVVGRCGGSTESADHDVAHSFKITLASEEEINQLMALLPTPTLEGTGFEEGEEPGNLMVREGFTPWETFREQHGLTAEHFNLTSYHNFCENVGVNFLLNKYTAAPVKTDRYIRIKASKKNMEAQSRPTEVRYLSDQNTSHTGNDTRSSFEISANEHTLFFYSPEQFMISANTGRYITKSSGTRVSNHVETLTTDNTAGSQAWNYQESAVAELGAYEMMIQKSGEPNRSMHLTATDNGGGADACSEPDIKHNFYIETVYELPVAVGANGYGSIIAPVALELPVVDGYQFYTFDYVVEGKNKNFRLSEVEIPAIVEANTPILVKGLAGESINLGIKYDYTAAASIRAREAAAEETPLMVAHGSHIACAHAADTEATEEYNTYALSSTEVGLNAGDVVFTPIAEGDELAAGTMHLTMPAKINEYMGGEEIVKDGKAVLNLNSQYTTGIREVVSGEQQGAEVIYDLQGRRLNAPIHGINIINGRKVLVK